MTESEKITQLMRQREFGWAIQLYSPPSEAGDYYANRMSLLRNFLAERGVGECAPNLDALESLVQFNSFKVDAFLEAMVSLKSVEILAAAWRLIQGMQVQALDLRYQHADSFSMTVTLESPYNETEVYQTSDIDDMNFVRHLMKSKSGNRPIINGFFSLRRPR